MNLGVLIVSITLLGSISNWLNGHYLRYALVHWFYFVGTLVHEFSHAVACVLTGARITRGSIFSSQPHITHTRPKLPVIGQPLISLAPMAGGLLFLFALNTYFLVDYFVLPPLNGWPQVLAAPVQLLAQVNLLAWQSWVMILLFLNVGAMVGPSWQDLRNIWFVPIIFFFFQPAWLVSLSSLVVTLILTNLLLQIVVVVVIKIVKTSRSLILRRRA